MNDFDFECHVINLTRTPQRLEKFLRYNAKTGLPFRRFEAVDGTTLSHEDAIRLKLIKPDTHWRTPGTLGVALSHRLLWEKAVAESKPLLVFEDDAFIREDVRSVLQAAVAEVGAWDIILLGSNTDAVTEFAVGGAFEVGALSSVRHPTVRQLSEFTRSRGPCHLFRLRTAFGISAYAISPSGARKLIQACFPMDNRPLILKTTKGMFKVFSIDCMMNAFYHSIRAYIFVGPLALPLNDWTSSTVDPRRT